MSSSVSSSSSSSPSTAPSKRQKKSHRGAEKSREKAQTTPRKQAVLQHRRPASASPLSLTTFHDDSEKPSFPSLRRCVTLSASLTTASPSILQAAQFQKPRTDCDVSLAFLNVYIAQGYATGGENRLAAPSIRSNSTHCQLSRRPRHLCTATSTSGLTVAYAVDAKPDDPSRPARHCANTHACVPSGENWPTDFCGGVGPYPSRASNDSQISPPTSSCTQSSRHLTTNPPGALGRRALSRSIQHPRVASTLGRTIWTLLQVALSPNGARSSLPNGTRLYPLPREKPSTGSLLLPPATRCAPRKAARSSAGTSSRIVVWRNGIRGPTGNSGSVVWSSRSALFTLLWPRLSLRRECTTPYFLVLT